MQKASIIAFVLLAVGLSCFAVTSYYTLIEVQKHPLHTTLSAYGNIDDTAYASRSVIIQMGGDKTLFIASIVLVPAGIAAFFYLREDLPR